MLSRKKFYLILIGLCLLAYSNSLNNAFISDDLPAILENPRISQISRSLLNPQGMLNSLAYLIAGFNPVPHHLISIILHALNTILVFIFLSLFFKTIPSFWGACIFAVHPIHTEAVTWISGRPYIITSLFILIGYFLYHKIALEVNSGKRINLKRYLLCLLIFSYYLVANLSFYFVFLPFLILADITFNRWQKTWRLWLPFLGVLILRVFLARNVLLERISFVAMEAGRQVTWSNPILNLAYSFFTHLGLLLWPAKLTLYHEPVIISSFVLRIEVVSVFLLLAISIFFLFRRAKKLFFALGIFVLFLAPTYSPVWICSIVAERYLYFSSIALSMAIAFGYEKYILKKQGELNKCALVVLIFLIFAYGIRTVLRNQDWKTPGIFWRKAVDVSPESMHVHGELALIYFKEGDIKNAIKHYNKAIEVNPRYADAYYNRGLVYKSQGNLNQVLQDYNKAIEINPNRADTYYNRGNTYSSQGNFNQALQDYSKAIEINPNFTKAYNNRGNIYKSQGNFSQALEDYSKAIEINPELAELYNNRGLVYRNQGNLKQSLQDFNKAIEIKPDYAEAYISRAIVYFQMQEYNKSWEDAHKAESLGYKVNPDFLDKLKSVRAVDQ